GRGFADQHGEGLDGFGAVFAADFDADDGQEVAVFGRGLVLFVGDVGEGVGDVAAVQHAWRGVPPGVDVNVPCDVGVGDGGAVGVDGGGGEFHGVADLKWRDLA